LAPATDFLLFDGFSAFPEVLGFFASFFFAHIVYLSIVVVLSSAPGSSWPPRAKSVTVSDASYSVDIEFVILLWVSIRIVENAATAA
jgi:uncharacterized membrane protein YhhN